MVAQMQLCQFNQRDLSKGAEHDSLDLTLTPLRMDPLLFPFFYASVVYTSLKDQPVIRYDAYFD